MKNYKTLKITDNPSVMTYAHHGYIHAILESDMCIGPTLFKFRIEDYNSYNWDICESNITLEQKEGDIFSILGSKYGEYEMCSIMRPLGLRDVLTVELIYQQYTHAECLFGIVVSNNKDLQDNIIKYQHVSSSGVGYKRGEEYVNLKHVTECYLPLKMKIKRDSDKLNYYLMNEQGEWIHVYNTILPMDMKEKPLFIGVCANADENQFYNWKYANYIQLSYNPHSTWLSVDYYNVPCRRYSYHYLHNFCEFFHVDSFEAENIFGDICRYVEWQLIHSRYVAIWLDEYYIPNREAYKRNKHIHQNLIFGYNSNTKTFKMIGYNQKIQEAQVSYSIFKEAFYQGGHKYDIEVIKYKPNNEIFKFNKYNFYIMIESYLKGKNSNILFGNVITEHEATFGLDIYKELINTVHGNNTITKDIRVSYIIYEHNQIMKERLIYLKEKAIFPNINFDDLIDEFNNILSLSMLLKNLVIKNNVKNGGEKNIVVKLKALYQMEIDFYTRFLLMIKPI